MNHMALIRKAAHGRDINLVGSVAFNRSAEALGQLGESVLAEIEAFLSKEFRSEVSAEKMEGQPWLGLASLFHVYFSVAANSRHANPGSFMLSLHGWIREEALRTVFVIWGPSQNATKKRSLPRGLLQAVSRLAVSGSQRERDFAKRLLRHQDHAQGRIRETVSPVKK